jgi:hypothetical protein
VVRRTGTGSASGPGVLDVLVLEEASWDLPVPFE